MSWNWKYCKIIWEPGIVLWKAQQPKLHSQTAVISQKGLQFQRQNKSYLISCLCSLKLQVPFHQNLCSAQDLEEEWTRQCSCFLNSIISLLFAKALSAPADLGLHKSSAEQKCWKLGKYHFGKKGGGEVHKGVQLTTDLIGVMRWGVAQDAQLSPCFAFTYVSSWENVSWRENSEFWRGGGSSPSFSVQMSIWAFHSGSGYQGLPQGFSWLIPSPVRSLATGQGSEWLSWIFILYCLQMKSHFTRFVLQDIFHIFL